MEEQIKELRRQIDRIDTEIIALIASRVAVAKELGKIKKSNHLPITDLAREAELKKLHQKVCQEYQLEYPIQAHVGSKSDNPDIEAVFERLIALSKKVQRKI